jgi:ssRNA-specific RNase YbeY (16S rRNA maturation enzyme)
MGLTLSVETVAEDPAIDPDELGRIVAPFLSGTVEIVLADPGYMRVMNGRFRHVDRPTDVLTFDLAEPGDSEPEGVIYVDSRLCPPVESLLERVFHGFLHLCGRTHDDPVSEERMAAEVASLVSKSMEVRS